MRQVLELHGCPDGAGAHWQAELRDAFYSRLLPQLEEACTQLATPDGVDRIERLEIDLGRVSPGRFEADLGERLEALLDRRLADAIEAAPPADTDLELFVHFIDSGALPWWADAADRSLLQASLQRLIGQHPQALRQCLLERAALRPVWQRLALSYPDALLGRLVLLLAPAGVDGSAAVLPTWLALLGPVARARGEAGRRVWWEETLRAHGAAAVAGGSAPGLWRAVLVRVARRLGSDEARLRAEVQRTLAAAAAAAATSGSDSAWAFWREFSADADGAAATAASPAASTHGAAGDAPLLEALRLLEAAAAAPGGAPGASLWARLRELLHQLPAPLRAQAAAAFDARSLAALAAPSAGQGKRPLGAVALRALAALVQAAREQGLVAPALIATVAELAEPLAALPALPPGAAQARRRPAAAAAPAQVSAFSSSDTLQVHNAGLVVLWPFLATFFERLGLTEQGSFKDEAAAQRGVGLLQVLAAADTAPPEPLLPLNKVLCGLAPETVFDFGAPCTAAEVDECEALLAAVIAQAPVLGAMSTAGFRGSFLLRAGQLGGRDGHWLLRVERLTHDIVLDRFPWGVQFVKLPWMDTVMQVEW